MKKFDVELVLASSYKISEEALRVMVYGVVSETKEKAKRIAKRSVELDATAYVINIKENSDVDK